MIKIREFNYPRNYKVIPSLNVCSNVIAGGGNIIVIGNVSPIIIGNGPVPKVWLYTRYDRENWVPLVVENKSDHSSIQVNENIEGRLVEIVGNDTLLIRAKMQNDGLCVVEQLDLRPIGLIIYGDTKALLVGTATFSNNYFEGVQFMIGINEGDEHFFGANVVQGVPKI